MFLLTTIFTIGVLLAFCGGCWAATGLWTININRRSIWVGSISAAAGFLLVLAWAVGMITGFG